MQDPVIPIHSHCIDCGLARIEAFRQRLTRGRCNNCYQRHIYALKKGGQFDSRSMPRPVLERLLEKGIAGPGGCVIWTGALGASGYGSLSIPGRSGGSPHRAIYELLNGPIPEGLHVDHTCHNRDLYCQADRCLHRRCFNPHHLEAVTARENHLRSPLKAFWNAPRPHCKRGHEYNEENTVTLKNGQRRCRECDRRRKREYYARLRERKAAA